MPTSSPGSNHCFKRQHLPVRAEAPEQNKLHGRHIASGAPLQPQQKMGDLRRMLWPSNAGALQSARTTVARGQTLSKNKSVGSGAADCKRAARQPHKAFKRQVAGQRSLSDMAGWHLVKHVPQTTQHSKRSTAFSASSIVSPGLRQTHGLSIKGQLPRLEAGLRRVDTTACALPSSSAQAAAPEVVQVLHPNCLKLSTLHHLCSSNVVPMRLNTDRAQLHLSTCIANFNPHYTSPWQPRYPLPWQQCNLHPIVCREYEQVVQCTRSVLFGHCLAPRRIFDYLIILLLQAQRRPPAVPDLDRAHQVMTEMGLNAAQKAAACASPERPLMIRAGSDSALV